MALTAEQKKIAEQLASERGQEAAQRYRKAVKAGKETKAEKIATGGKESKDKKRQREGAPVPFPDTSGTADTSIGQTQNILGGATDYGKEWADEYIPVGTFGQLTPEQLATTPAMREYLDKLKGQMDTIGNLTPLEQEAIDAMRAGMAGYSSPEVQAMREQANQEINRQYKTAMSEQRIAQARGNVRGAAASAQAADLGVGRQLAEGNLERDLLIQNAQEAQSRKEAFANAVRGTEDARFGRQATTQGQYGAALSGEEAARMNREQFNITQKSDEALGRATAAAGGAGVYVGAQQAQQAALQQEAMMNWLAQEQVAQRKFARREAKRSFRRQSKLLDQQMENINNMY